MFEQTFQVRFNGRWSFQTCLEFDAIKLICTPLNLETMINSLHVDLNLCLKYMYVILQRLIMSNRTDLFTFVSPVCCRGRSTFALLIHSCFSQLNISMIIATKIIEKWNSTHIYNHTVKIQIKIQNPMQFW